MEKRIIGNDYFKGFTPLENGGTEAVLLHKGDILAKIMDKKSLKGDREIITERLETLDHDGLVKPQCMLYNRKKYIGFLMKYLKNFQNLSDLITNDLDDSTIPFEQRKQLMISLSQIFDYFFKTNYAYIDIHGYNILLKDGKIHIIDLDSGIFKGTVNCDMDYDVAIRVQSQNLAMFTLSFLYNLDTYTFYRLTRKNSLFYKLLPASLERFYTYSLKKEYGVFYDTTESLDKIDEDTIFETSYALKKKIKY